MGPGLAKRVEVELRALIYSGILPAGRVATLSELIDDYLVPRLGLKLRRGRESALSPTPVRQAIEVLKREGLVEVRHLMGIVVSTISSEALEAALVFRAALETVTVVRLSEMKGIDFGELEQILKEQDRAVRDDDPRRFFDQGVLFHKGIARLAGFESQIDVLETLWTRCIVAYAMRLPLTTTVVTREDRRAILDEHRRLLTHIRRGEAKQAAACLRTHLVRQRVRTGSRARGDRKRADEGGSFALLPETAS